MNSFTNHKIVYIGYFVYSIHIILLLLIFRIPMFIEHSQGNSSFSFYISQEAEDASLFKSLCYSVISKRCKQYAMIFF